jgi:AraC-like DNA-binding protein
MRRVVVAADAAATMALLSDLRGAVRVRARAGDGDGQGGMRLEQDRIGPVTLDRMTFGAALDFDAGSAEVLVFGHVSGGSAGFRTGAAEHWHGDSGAYLAGQPGRAHTSMIRGGVHDQVVIDPALPSQVADTAPGRTQQPVRFTGYEPISAQAARQWRATYAYIRDTAPATPDSPAGHLIAANAARLLVATALAVFPNNALTDPTSTDRHDAHPGTVQRAVTFIDEHADDDITIADIAAAAFVTVRAIQLAFRRHLDTTPMEYLRQVRLDRARRDLAAADPARETVTSIAYRWGFSNVSRFAAAYRRAYGVLPKHTLYQD